MKTIKELSEELGVSKVAISNKIKNNGLKERMVKQGNTYYLDSELEAEIIGLFKNSRKQNNETSAGETPEQRPNSEPQTDMVEWLKSQIEELNNQLKAKDRQIENLQALNMAQAQNINMLLPSAEAHVVEAEITQVTQTQGDTEEPQSKRKGLFDRLFR